jgi:hypothetical protein
MPNWTENDLTITGPDVQKILNAIRSDDKDDEDARLLDFNTIIPYPQAYKEMDQRAREYREKFFAIAQDDPERGQKLEALAAEYGVEPGSPWIKDGYNSGGYDWCCDNWATKWNATRVHLTTRKDDSKPPVQKNVQCGYCQTVHDTTYLQVWICKQCGSPLPDVQPIMAFLEFDTAWSPPIPVIEKLAEMFPDHAFELQYFEGGMGFSGHARWSEGIEEYHHQYEYAGPRGG